MPAIVRSYDELKKMGVQYLIVSDEDQETISNYRDNNNIELPFLLLTGTDYQAMGIQSLPTTFVLDPDGRVVFMRIGPFPWDKPIFLDEMKRFSEQY